MESAPNPSYWMAVTSGEDPPSAPLPTGAVDVVVVGAGILGLLTAHHLVAEGLSVAMVDRGLVGAGVTGRSTAKVTALHGVTLQALRAAHGPEVAAAYAEANRWGVDEIARIVSEEAIECGWSWAPAVTYAVGPEAGTVEAEGRAASEAGLAVKTGATDVGLPYPVAAAVELDQQGMVNPRRLCLGLAERLAARGVTVTTGCTAEDVEDGRVDTTMGPLTATTAIVLATHLPFLNRGGQFATSRPMHSYVIAAEVSRQPPPGMLLGVDDEGLRSLRRIDPDGSGVLIAGDGHVTGRDENTDRHPAALERWGVEHLALARVSHRWSAHDYKTAKGFPSVGELPFGDVPIYAGTGFGKWGFSNSAAAARVITNLVMRRPHPWPELATGLRRAGLRAVAETARINVEVAGRFAGDRASSGGEIDVDAVRPGGATVGRWNGRRVALHRTDDGRLVVLDPRCTHLGCLVHWNAADRSWDCPCHGSRFTAEGSVFDGPATSDLGVVEAPEPER